MDKSGTKSEFFATLKARGRVDPVDLTSTSNICIAIGYFSVGISQAFSITPLNIYLVHVLRAEPAMQNTVGILQALPWSLKIVIGFLSDAVPLFGMHRKPYLTIGSLVYSAAYLIYGIYAAQAKHDLVLLCACTFFGAVGLIMVDVMCDTMCVERSKFEPTESKGQMQASCYSCRFAGNVLGSILGTIVSEVESPFYMTFAQVCYANGFIPLVFILPWLWSLKEKFLVSNDTSVMETGGVNNSMRKSNQRNSNNQNSVNYNRSSSAGSCASQSPKEIELQYDEAVRAAQHYKYGYSASRRISDADGHEEVELVEKIGSRSYLTTPVKAIKRFSVSAKSSGFVNNGLAGAGNGNSSGSDSIGGGYGTVSPVNKTPRTPKGNFNRGPQSTPKIPRTPKESADHQQKLSDQSPSFHYGASPDASLSSLDIVTVKIIEKDRKNGTMKTKTKTKKISFQDQDQDQNEKKNNNDNDDRSRLSFSNSDRVEAEQHSQYSDVRKRIPVTSAAFENNNPNSTERSPLQRRTLAGGGVVEYSFLGSDDNENNHNFDDFDNLYDFRGGGGSDNCNGNGTGFENVEESERESDIQRELETKDMVPVERQLKEMWGTVQLQAVWKPMAFVYLYNLLQVPNVAWQSYLQLTLEFPAWILGLTATLGSIMTFAGVVAFKYWFFKATWRAVYLWSTALTTLFSFMQLILIFQINTKYLHMHNFLFSMGDDVITAYISGIQFLPVCIMYMGLCPEGAEGASYAMLTTFGNIALSCANSLGNVMASFWDVSNTTLEEGDVSGLWKLSILTSVLAVLPLLLIHMLPNNAEEQKELAKSRKSSRIGGQIFLGVLAISLLWTVSNSVWQILDYKNSELASTSV